MTEYLRWLANVVPISKKDDSVYMCIDFSDHNEASLKDDFPLPYFNILDDNEARHELLDGFSEYNKIKVVPEDA